MVGLGDYAGGFNGALDDLGIRRLTLLRHVKGDDGQGLRGAGRRDGHYMPFRSFWTHRFTDDIPDFRGWLDRLKMRSWRGSFNVKRQNAIIHG